MTVKLAACLLSLSLAASVSAASLPIFDAHLHYSVQDARRFGPDEILAILERNGIVRAVVSGAPHSGIELLYAQAPERIVPLLSVYREASDKRTWMHDRGLPARVERWLQADIYRGIGELHIFAEDRDSQVLARLVAVAADKGLVLQIHGDPEVIDRVFDLAPEATVLWAHLGTRPQPGVLREMLARYPEGLYVDTSVRDERIAPNGRLRPEWRRLFLDYEDRILVGVDTHWVRRWARFDAVVARIRRWLRQLPAATARKLACANAERLFTAPARDQPEALCGRE